MEEEIGVATAATGVARAGGPVPVAAVALPDAVLDERDVGASGVTDPAELAERGHERGSVVALEPDLGRDAEGRRAGEQLLGRAHRRWVGHQEAAPHPLGQGLPDRGQMVEVVGSAGHVVDAHVTPSSHGSASARSGPDRPARQWSTLRAPASPKE